MGSFSNNNINLEGLSLQNPTNVMSETMPLQQKDRFAHSNFNHGKDSDSDDQQHHPRKVSGGKHWQAPFAMCSSFLAGTGIAVVHHLFYRHWNRMEVDLSWHQSWITRFGTAFAVLVTTFLGRSASGAYVQQQWLSMHSRAFRIYQVDKLFDALRNPFSFTDIKLWIRNPLLSLLASVAW